MHSVRFFDGTPFFVNAPEMILLAREKVNRIKDVFLFEPSEAEFPIGFNILQAKLELEKALLSSDLAATFRRMSASWGDVMDKEKHLLPFLKLCEKGK